VESDILIDFLKGLEGARAVLERAADEGVIRLSAVSVAQVVASSTGKNREPAIKLLESFNIVPVDKGVASRAGFYLSHDRRDKFDLCDCLVAATCEQLAAVLVTKDRSRYPADSYGVMPAQY
jgi:predicted nucleic acid-binding protein